MAKYDLQDKKGEVEDVIWSSIHFLVYCFNLSGLKKWNIFNKTLNVKRKKENQGKRVFVVLFVVGLVCWNLHLTDNISCPNTNRNLNAHIKIFEILPLEQLTKINVCTENQTSISLSIQNFTTFNSFHF